MCDLQIFNFHNFKFILSLNFHFGLPMSHLTALFRSFIITTEVQILSLFGVKVSVLFYILFLIVYCQRFLRIFANPFADCSILLRNECGKYIQSIVDQVGLVFTQALFLCYCYNLTDLIRPNKLSCDNK